MKKLILVALLATTSLAQATDILLSSGIKSKLRTKIEKDLNVLDNFKFKAADQETLDLFAISDLNSITASKWLDQRVSYVIEENAMSVIKLLIKKAIFTEREGVTFPNADKIPYVLDNGNKLVQAEEEAFVVMSNIGSALYFGGKSEKKVYGMKISRGLFKKPVKALAESPRVGIIQIGEGLFVKDLTINNQNPDSIANSLNRLATFFHEARHSDGNGVSLSYFHATCPAGHNYAGVPACDENLNGPYSIGTAFLKEVIKSCDSCSERERETFRAIAIDNASRVLKVTKKGTPTTNWDPTPESL